MKIKLIRWGSLMTMYNGIYAIFYGILTLSFSKVILSEYFNSSPVPWRLFASSFPYRANLYYSLLLTSSFFMISLGIFIIYISYFVLKRKDKLAWVILFSGGILSWASLFIISWITGSWIIRVLSFVGWVSFIIGMALPLKYYLKKDYHEF